MLSVITEIDSRAMAPGLGYGSTVELVRAIARIPRGEARARVNAAADVLPGRGVNGAPVEPKRLISFLLRVAAGQRCLTLDVHGVGNQFLQHVGG
jgi:hypothetical protein